MSFCVNADCRKDIEDDYAFCPYCGHDNRPPHAQSGLVACAHRFVPEGPYCVGCGNRLVASAVKAARTRNLVHSSKWWVIAGVCFTLLGIYVALATYRVAPAPQSWSAWLHEEMYRSFRRSRTITRRRGHLFVLAFGVLGAAMIAGGLKRRQGIDPSQDWT